MTAGYFSLLKENPEIFQSLENKTAYLNEGFENALKKKYPTHNKSFGSMMSLHFTSDKVVDFTSHQRVTMIISKSTFMNA